MNTSHEINRLLAEHRAGNTRALDELLPLVYGELKRIAAYHLRAQPPGHTLQPTALVHEAYLKLAGNDAGWENRAHFVAVASKAMRHVLVDSTRARLAEKRGGGTAQVELDRALEVAAEQGVDLLALDEVLSRLASADPRAGEIVEMRAFGGLTVPEIAEALGVSRATVEREWAAARAWLRAALAGP